VTSEAPKEFIESLFKRIKSRPAPEPVKKVALKKKSRDERERKPQTIDHDFLRRRVEEGLPVYTEDELNIGKGGGTKECPFDCDCCF